ncbi:MAG: acyltransferase [Candidatus Eremiobacteraeota bacterium]|nr:acyltransferase [Candidatus Eremiobacteraeota bacterium]
MAASGNPLAGRIHYMDGLRALAVLSVLLYHCVKYDRFFPDGPLKHAFFEGAHGVDLFFVISGFVLSYPTLSKLRLKGIAVFDIATYLAHRFIRILPPYVAAVAFCSLALLAIVHWNLRIGEGVINPGITWVDIAKQLVFLDQGTRLGNLSFWSLSVEFRWYFLFPLLLLLFVRSMRAFALLGLALIVAGGFTRLGSLDLLELPAFMLGIAAAQIEIDKPKWAWLGGPLAVATGAIAVAIEPANYWDRVQLSWQLTMFCFVVAGGALPWLRSALGLGPLRAIGIISYSLYLVHAPIVGVLLGNTTTRFYTAALVAIAGGALFWAVFERPFMATELKGRLTASLTAPLRRLLDWLRIPLTMQLSPPALERAPLSVPASAVAGADAD